MTDILLVALGLVFLVTGGEALVRGAVGLAQRAGLSPMVIGLTLVGFGTSTPELVTSLQAAFAGSPGIAIGNVVGSNIGNILLILAIAALLRPVAVNPAAFRRDGAVLAASALLIAGLMLATGGMGRGAGLVCLAALVAYLAFALWQERARATPAAALYAAEADIRPLPQAGAGRQALTALLGLAATILGARLLVTGAIGMAQAAGISETVIGLTIVAVGTSLPELVTTIIAVRKGESDVALGNIVGSNIFNALGILGLTAALRPMEAPAQILALDLWVMLGATAACLLFARTGWRVGRREGAAMLAAYVLYLAVLLRAAG